MGRSNPIRSTGAYLTANSAVHGYISSDHSPLELTPGIFGFVGEVSECPAPARLAAFTGQSY